VRSDNFFKKFINQINPIIMNKNLNYSAPQVEVMEMNTEGVLCESVTGANGSVTDWSVEEW
jgi:hypothetical protein